MTLNRSYEISIWTLQDEFISVLKPSDIENKGFVEKPIVTFKSDSVDTLTFSIPKFLYLETDRILNPIWGNVQKGNFTKNLHKIKVIFNKEDEAAREVAEFIILDVKEKHENDQVTTEISCEGLAFHELGKRGYKISLTADGYYSEYNAWFDDTTVQRPIEPPKNNLQYWTEKFMQPAPTDDTITDVNTWYYEIQMDWSSYAGSGRDSDKVYEEEYTASWEYDNENSNLKPSRVEAAKEKLRLVDIEKSNIYNITQKIAETFGVFCKYKYLYDNNFHIIGRRVIYYNNYIQEKDGYLDLTYPYTTSAVTRNREGKDITTKMFVEEVQSEVDNTISIMDNDANKSQEDYLLNFDYLKQIGELTEEQIQGITDYESEMHLLNNKIKSFQNTLRNLSQIKNDLKSQQSVLQNSIGLDQERIEESDDYFNNLIEKSGNEDGTISIGSNNYDRLVMMEDSRVPGTYYITLSREGILVDTVYIYYTRDYSTENNFADEITNWIPEYDNYNNLYKISNLRKPTREGLDTTQNRVYLIYNYSPKLYHELVKNTYLSKLAQDQQDLDSTNLKLEVIENKLLSIQQELDEALSEKETKRQDFEVLMGPALRESYWRPEDYNDYGNTYLDVLNPNTNVNGASGYTSFLWDAILFDEEQKSYYEFGVEKEKKYYPCINLKPYLKKLEGHWDELSFLFYDFYKADAVEAPSRLKALAIDSQAQYGFVEDTNHNIIPVLILTGIEGMTQSSLNRLVTAAPRLGKMQVTVDDDIPSSEELETITTTVDTWVYLTPADFINAVQDASENYSFTEVTLLYPRIKIDSFKLKDVDQDGVKLKFDEQVLNNYEDFYILTRDVDLDNLSEEISDSQEYDIDPFYCVTIKPVAMIKYGIDKTLETQEEGATDERPLVTAIDYKDITVNFILSNASTAIYLDAIQVLKENAFPRISYDITPSVFDPSFMYTAYNKMHRIVNINDIDLHLTNIQGYISQVELNLDNPWEDKYEVKNYRTKFEDLFTSIVAQTEAMQRNEFTMTLAANALTPEGLIYEDVLQNTFRRVDFDYAFNNGALTINEEDGIWGTSDTGVVAYRGGGIFTAIKKDDDGNWLWNTGITPEGINADLITTGQLDINRINIYAGDNIRFQMNADGLYAYKPILEDKKLIKLAQDGDEIAQTFLQNAANFDFNTKQYVVHNPSGLFLTAEAGTIIAEPKNNTEVSNTEDEQSETEYTAKVLPKEVNRVEISWDGLKLRNWDGAEVFSADPDTGDLSLTGYITAKGLTSDGNITISSGDKLIINGETFINGPLTIDANRQAAIKEVMSDVTQYYDQIKEVVTIDGAGVHVAPTNNSGYSTLTDSQGFHIYQDNTPIASFAAKGTFVNRLQVGNIVVKESNTHGWSWVPAK